MDRDSEDLFLGKKALDRKLITPAQLREAMMKQASAAAPEGAEPPRLGDVFISERLLTPDQLSGLQEETRRITRGAAPPRDSTLGRILVDKGTITNSQLLECLKVQDEALRAGVTVEPRLGELLVNKGYASAEEIRHALAVQEKTILTCTQCGKRCNAASYDATRRYACPACKAELKPHTDAVEVSVHEQTQELPSVELEGRMMGKYRVSRELGRGGMGVVYEALDTSLNRRVALKMLMLQPKADPEATRIDEERFLREAKLTAQLPPHPHVVGVYEVGVLDGSRYIAMELIEGKSMLDWWKDKSIRLRQQVAVLRDAALGVQHAHNHGVIHRDLKPENILIDASGQPHITDFGLARSTSQSPKDALTGKGMVVGSPHYMSPEAVQGLRVDRRADVYSLGVILYEMFTGKRPYDGGTPEEIMLKALKADAPSPSSVMRSQMNPILHRSLEHVCLKAIAKDPRERYVSAKAFADDLTRWLGGEEVEADLPQKRRQRKMIMMAAIAAGVVVTAALGFVVMSQPSADRELASAAQHLQKGDLAAARAAYERVLASHPGRREAVEGRDEVRRRQLAQRMSEAEKLMTQGRFSEALDSYMLILIEEPGLKAAAEGKEEAKRKMVQAGSLESKADKRP